MVDEFRKREERNQETTTNISKEEEEVVIADEEEPPSLSISSPPPPTIDSSSSLTTTSSPFSSMNQKIEIDKIDKEEEIDQNMIKEIDQKQQNQPNEKDIILDKKDEEIEVGIGIVKTGSQDDIKKEDG